MTSGDFVKETAVFLGPISRVDWFIPIQYVLGTICVFERNVYSALCDVMYVLPFIG